MSIKQAAAVFSATIITAIILTTSGAGAGVTPTTGQPETATLTVTKVVEGTAPAGTQFVILVDCEVSGDHELNYGEAGGSEEVVFFQADSCTLSEPEDGGASSTTGLDAIDIEEPILYSRTVTNTFDPAPTSSTPSTTNEVAADTATRPRFTG